MGEMLVLQGVFITEHETRESLHVEKHRTVVRDVATCPVAVAVALLLEAHHSDATLCEGGEERVFRWVLHMRSIAMAEA